HGRAETDFGARRKRLRAGDHGHTLAHEGPVLHARHDLLADEATLCEGHTMEAIVVGFVWEGIPERIVEPAFRNAERDAAFVIYALRYNLTRKACELRARHDKPPAEFAMTRIGIRPAT